MIGYKRACGLITEVSLKAIAYTFCDTMEYISECSLMDTKYPMIVAVIRGILLSVMVTSRCIHLKIVLHYTYT